jgi:hypothetical protein
VVRDRDGDESGWEAGEADEFSNPREPKTWNAKTIRKRQASPLIPQSELPRDERGPKSKWRATIARH